ncbi:MAG: hypothetical protein V3W18_10925 [candidate division Zixibacteria bacterium]
MDIAILSKYWFLYLLAGAIGIGVGVLSYKTSFPLTSKLTRISLATLRGIMITLIGLFLIEPVLNLYSWNTVNPKLAVLLDNSKSMELKIGEQSRIGLADSLNSNWITSLADNYDLFTFSTEMNEIDNFPVELDSAGNATAIASALGALETQKDFDDYGAVLLVTDGRQNLGPDPVATALDLDLPVYTLTVGEVIDDANIAVDNVAAPAHAYSGDYFKIEANIRAAGVVADKSIAFLKLDGKAIAEKQFDIPGEGRMTAIEFEIQAPDPGMYRYEISLPILEGETEKVDNKRVVSVNVLKNRIRILLTAATLDWEYKFIKQSLSGFDEFEIDAVYQLNTGRFSQPGPPNTFDELANYDIAVIVNCRPEDVRIPRSNLKKFVNEGSALIYVAGADFTSDIKSYDNLLPLEIVNPAVNEGEYLFEPSPTRKQHAAVLLDDDPESSARIWHSLPPFTVVISGVKPIGDVLLETRTRLHSDGVVPVLTVGEFGKGRSAVFTGYPLWRSYFGAKHENSDAIPLFWKNLVRWATAKGDMKNFEIAIDREVYRLGEPIRMSGYLYDEANKPKGGALVNVSLVPDGDNTVVKDAVLTQSGSGIYSGEVTSLAPGDYTYNAIAMSYGDTLGTTDGKFTVEQFSLELTSAAPDYNLTRRISEATGGKAYTADNFGEFLNDLKLTPFEREKHTRIKPFGMPLFLIIVLCGLCVEWGIRKRLRLP